MKTTWTKKVKWFKPSKEIVLPELEWQYTYLNTKGNAVECVIINDHENGYVDVLNKNGVKVFYIHIKRLTKIIDE